MTEAEIKKHTEIAMKSIGHHLMNYCLKQGVKSPEITIPTQQEFAIISAGIHEYFKRTLNEKKLFIVG